MGWQGNWQRKFVQQFILGIGSLLTVSGLMNGVQNRTGRSNSRKGDGSAVPRMACFGAKDRKAGIYYHRGQKTALWDKLEVIRQKGGHKKKGSHHAATWGSQ